MSKFQPGISVSDGKPCPPGREYSPRNAAAENMTNEQRKELAARIKKLRTELEGQVDLSKVTREMPKWYFEKTGTKREEVYSPG